MAPRGFASFDTQQSAIPPKIKSHFYRTPGGEPEPPDPDEEGLGPMGRLPNGGVLSNAGNREVKAFADAIKRRTNRVRGRRGRK